MADTEYKLAYDGPQVDAAIGRALPNGEIAAALESKAEIELLDNVDFTNPVAQAGIGGLHGSVAYAVDRWKLISGTVSWASNGMTLNGTIRQIREFSIGFPVVASIEMHSGTATITYDDSTKYCDITSSGGVIKRPHLGLREITDWAKVPSADYGEELRKCRMYYREGLNLGCVVLNYIDQIYYLSGCSLGEPMRTTPSVKIYSARNGTENRFTNINGDLQSEQISLVYADSNQIHMIKLNGAPLSWGSSIYSYYYAALSDL